MEGQKKSTTKLAPAVAGFVVGFACGILLMFDPKSINKQIQTARPKSPPRLRLVK